MSSAAAAKSDGKQKASDKAPSSGPFSAFERMIAWRYLRARRRETFISVIAGFSFTGIMLGVATLIIVMAVMNGFRAELLNRILGINGHLIMQPIDRPLDDYASLITRIDGISGVKFAIPVVEGQALVQGNIGAGTGALVRGLREEDLAKLKLVSDNIKQGTLQGFDQGGGVAIGTRMAENLGLSIGDTLRVISPDGDVTPFGVNPRVKAYPIVAIFEIGMSEYDASIVMMPLSEAQLFFNQEGKVQSVEIFVDNPDKVDAMRAPVEEVAARQISMVDWRQRNQTFFSALQVERNVMFMILTLIVLVAALNIISGLIMLVKDKGRDIAILRTMGATRGAVMRIFLMTGAAIGVTGTLAGVVLGVVVCLNVERIRQFFSWLSGTTLFNPELYFLSTLPAKMDVGETFSVIAMALVLSFIATILPAWRAAKLDPVEALRYE
ncbi:lipoprotein-releasing ABC transporter permease subunit [Brucella pseudogrignonensis]|jgi:lipoprotein-releasing system permease protein|uniref:lipoprotein-releasing ABC transporter permease subunit n=1 Tax=Brucella pseudogrignonensis TaxID=419475 RepID=UPI000CFE322C|nr:lipoprotein-releasing ABC transporter permease subunit [Brucella pseudogrignonensis]MBK0020766.1 lipoprotein-releasing ABC transporter permease subunit [Ochrobactrum sp. S45]MBK0042495.1 lipoprotein-releasing ABC transporter permease subunit [Ochrobactrum sp. S46]MBO1024059.1 lipoprotein-releasing ABC transporter permease subunit [Ochrobactrum sp. SD129]MQP38487.1 lipoprotein-releasing ABC transporter permease subunit [Ochrobactrum sp. MYb237]PQZ43124.1 lipoprotein-releasing system transmem